MRVYVKLLLFLATVIDILSHSHIYSLCPFYYTAFFFFCKWYRPIYRALGDPVGIKFNSYTTVYTIQLQYNEFVIHVILTNKLNS